MLPYTLASPCSDFDSFHKYEFQSELISHLTADFDNEPGGPVF